MKNFWGYAHNERFGVGCTGQSVYIYDAEGRELKRFSGLRYAYTPLLCPGKPLLAVKSAEPWLLFYDLERLEAVKKLRLRKPNQQTQDDGCCFSPDGERFFNLEAQNDMTGQLVIYDTREFAEQARLFEGARLVPQHIEPAESGDAYFLLGYERPAALEGDNR